MDAELDAENRLKSAVSSASGDTMSMTYDGEGRRVRTVTGTRTTYFVYDAFGNLAAEYATGSVAAAVCTTCWVTVDHLGSVRALSGATGVRARYDYLPFGEMIRADRGNRSAVRCAADAPGCYGVADATRQRFTGKERDAETGLDYFGARYFSGAQGRFTSPDPSLASGKAEDPQTWNRYAYVTNNPLRYIDPDGRERAEAFLNQDVRALLSGQISRQEYRARLEARGYGALAGAGLVSGYATAATFGRSLLTAAVGWVLGHPQQTQEIATGTAEALLGMEGPGTPRLIPTGDIDAAAGALAKKLGGQASVIIEGFGNREFDSISKEFVGQTFGAASALLKPDNFLSKDRKAQIRATLEAAKATGRRAYFEFRQGAHDEVLDFIRRNAERAGVGYEVDR